KIDRVITFVVPMSTTLCNNINRDFVDNSETRSNIMHAYNGDRMITRVTKAGSSYSVRKHYMREQYSHFFKKVNCMVKDVDQREDLVKEDLVSEMVKDRMDDHEVKVKVNSGVEVIVGETRMVESKVLESSVGMNEVNGGMSDHSTQLLQESTRI